MSKRRGSLLMHFHYLFTVSGETIQSSCYFPPTFLSISWPRAFFFFLNHDSWHCLCKQVVLRPVTSVHLATSLECVDKYICVCLYNKLIFKFSNFSWLGGHMMSDKTCVNSDALRGLTIWRFLRGIIIMPTVMLLFIVKRVFFGRFFWAICAWYNFISSVDF